MKRQISMVGQSLTVHPKLNGEAASRAENDFPESFEPRKINRFIIKLGCLFASGMCFLSLASVHAGIYYVSPNGSTTNSGFSTNTPWSLGKINYNSSIPSNSTIIILPGIYEETNKQNTTAGPVIYSPYVTVKSEIKWGAVLRDSSDYGIQAQTNNVTIDGLRIINALKCGINGSAAFGVDSNLVVQNCWISYCGTNPISGVGPSGIANGYANNQIVQDNLIEHIGNTHQAIYDHGIYLAGNNIIIKNNVVRYCSGAGIQLNDHTPGCYGSSNVLIFNNLIYSNGNWGMYLSSDGSNNVSTTIYNNTVYGSPYALAAETLIPGITYMNCSNNILLATTAQTLKESHAFSTNSVINADFNLMAKVDHLPVGSHSIITDNAGFVNPSTGLFWLRSNSPARGAAYAGLYPTNDFFGNPQTNSLDLGAFQYNSLYASDTRVLDPSPASPDYWLDLLLLLPPTHLRTVPGFEP